MHDQTVIFSIFLVFCGAAILSTVALYTRQSLLVAYILLGVLLGPWCLGWVTDTEVINQTGSVGIIFLLFLLGLNLHPQNLWRMLRKVSWIALVSSLVFAIIGFQVANWFGYTRPECLIVAAAMMFSSTIVGLKLLPTTILHHQHTGEVVISILLLQDIIAILTLLGLHVASVGKINVQEIVLLSISLPVLFGFAYVMERFVLVRLIQRFDQIQEYVFLLSVAWCLGMAELAKALGLSAEVGAFIGGVALAASPISLYISESLKPLRDFFLVLFFFSIGASFNLNYLHIVIVPALILAVLMMVLKPVVFRMLFAHAGENKQVSWEVGVRLGQISEFSLLIVYLAAGTKLIGESASYLVQATTLLTFIASSYWVVMKYPTPLAFSEKMRQN